MPCRAQDLPAPLGDVRAALELSRRISRTNQLTLEPGRSSAADLRPELPDDELGFRMQSTARPHSPPRLSGSTEVSAYARPGAQCATTETTDFGDYWALRRRARQAHAPRARDHHAQRREREPRHTLARGWRGEPATSTVASADCRSNS